jgi:hypothetical protein
MKKRTEGLLLAAGTAISAGVAYCAESKAAKILASCLTRVGGGILIFRHGKQHLQEVIEEVNSECDETERFIEKSGVDPDILENDNLLEQEETDDRGDVICAPTLFRQARTFLDDDQMNSLTFNEHTIHVLQDKLKLVIVLQMPVSQKKGTLRGQNMYLFFKETFLDYAAEDEIGITAGINIYQKGFARLWEDNKLKYEPIEKLEGEETREYVKRVNSVLKTWEELDSYRDEQIESYKSMGKELKGYDNFMFIEFPIKRDGDILPGMTVTKTMWLIQELMETYYEIVIDAQGTKKNFEFDRVLFHPGSDLGEVLAWNDEDKVIEEAHL